MRNTLEHPVTREEILAVLDTALQRALDNQAPGDLDGIVLQLLYDRLANNEHLLKNVFGGYEHFGV